MKDDFSIKILGLSITANGANAVRKAYKISYVAIPAVCVVFILGLSPAGQMLMKLASSLIDVVSKM